MVKDLKPYPRPVLKVDGQTVLSEAADQIGKLETALQGAKTNGLPVGILDAYSQEIAALKETQPKAAKPAQSKGVLLTQLQHRLKAAGTLTQNASERRQKQYGALDNQIQQLDAIREYKVKDFAETQQAFAARLAENKHTVSGLMADLGTLVKDSQPNELAIATVLTQESALLCTTYNVTSTWLLKS